MYSYVKKALRLLGLTVLILLLGGCSLASGDGLLLLPKVPAEYVQLQQQLDTILANGASYAVAETGTNRQAVQLVDLNGDGTEEALAFFRTDSGAYQMYAFRQDEEGYKSLGMAEGYGTALRAVYYPRLADGSVALAMCWGFDEGGSYGMTVYGFSQHGMSVLMDIQYGDVTIRDIDGDGAEEMAFAIRDNVTGLYSARVYQYRENQYRILSEVPMCLEVRSVANMQFGRVEGDQLGLYVDSLSTAGGYVTDLICYDGQMAANRTIDQASGSGSKTWRAASVFCSDINGDGRMDVPISHTFPYEPNEVEARLRLDWYNFDRDGGEMLVGSTLHAVSENWYLDWPEVWGDQVRVTKSGGAGLSKTVFSLQKSGEDSSEVLTLWMFSGDDREQSSAIYKKLSSLTSTAAGIYRYSIPQGADPKTALTGEQLKALFHTIESSWHSEEY